MSADSPYPYLIHHYVHDDEIADFEQRVVAWHEERRALMTVSTGSASYSGYRPYLFSFKRDDEAALFRLFFGGSLERTFSPTLSKRPT